MLGILQVLVSLSGFEARARAAIVRLVTVLLLALLAATFAAIALGFAASAGYGYLATVVSPPAAAGLCAGVALLVALAFTAAGALRLRRPSRLRSQGAQPDLMSALSPLAAWIRTHPLETAAAALVVGLASGRRRS